MEVRKNPKYDLRQYQTLFFNIGLVLSLLMVIAAFEWRFYDKEDLMNMGPTNVEFVETMDVPLTEQPPPPPPKALKNVEIIAVEDIEDIEEDIDIDLDIDITEDMAVEEVQPVEVEEPEEEETEEVFLIVEEPPSPVGGMEAFYNYVNENIQYPRQARTMRIEGRVFVQFVVDKDGSITNVEVLKGIGGGCDEEAVRVVKNAPKWNPGKQRGRPVRVKMVLPITFKLL